MTIKHDITQRDWDYIETRLMVPAGPAAEAAARLKRLGFTEEGDRIYEAIYVLRQACRAVRREVGGGR